MSEELAAGVLVDRAFELGLVSRSRQSGKSLKLIKADGLNFLARRSRESPWGGLWLARSWFDRRLREARAEDDIDEDGELIARGRKRAARDLEGQMLLTKFFSKLPRVGE